MHGSTIREFGGPGTPANGWVMACTPANSWVMRLDLLYESTSMKYSFSMYWAFQTLTTVGYGDVRAVRNDERIIAIIWMVFGVGFYAYIIGYI